MRRELVHQNGARTPRIGLVLVGLVLVALGAAHPVLAASDPALGAVSLPNSGAPEAQAGFLQGLAALHSFWYDEAADLFHQARDIDPDFALAYWGQALTLNHPLWGRQDLAGGRRILAQLAPSPELRAAKAPTALEKGLLATVEVLYGEGSKEERDRAYSQALGALHRDHPENSEVAALYALSLLGTVVPGQQEPRTQMQAAAVAEEVFARNPRHPGAAHYLIHAYDDPVHAPLGLRAARVYAEIAPAAHHALHMPSHIFLQLGMWDEVVSSNEGAYAASVRWVKRRGHDDDQRDLHSLAWLQYGRLQKGQVSEAEDCLRMVEGLAVTHPRLAADAVHFKARQMVETGQWVELNDSDGLPYRGSDAVLLAVVGMSAARRGDGVRATWALEGLRSLAVSGYHARVTALLDYQVAGLVALAAGEDRRALDLLSRGAQEEAALPLPVGPPIPMKPAHELYGEVLLERDRPRLAAVQFEAALERTPNRPASLLGLARAAARLEESQKAQTLYTQLTKIWHQADAGFASLGEARRFLAAEGRR